MHFFFYLSLFVLVFSRCVFVPFLVITLCTLHNNPRVRCCLQHRYEPLGLCRSYTLSKMPVAINTLSEVACSYTAYKDTFDSVECVALSISLYIFMMVAKPMLSHRIKSSAHKLYQYEVVVVGAWVPLSYTRMHWRHTGHNKNGRQIKRQFIFFWYHCK